MLNTYAETLITPLIGYADNEAFLLQYGPFTGNHFLDGMILSVEELISSVDSSANRAKEAADLAYTELWALSDEMLSNKFRKKPDADRFRTCCFAYSNKKMIY